MFALEGIPAVYIHSLFGTENDHQRVEHTGRLRSINRHIWREEQLSDALADRGLHHGQVFERLKTLLALRRRQPAFHPNATQFTMHLGTEVFGFWRQSMNRRQSIFCLYNITAQPQYLNLSDINLISTDSWRDLISGVELDDLSSRLELAPYQALWLTNWEAGVE
jgi:sucrose phosphorylase